VVEKFVALVFLHVNLLDRHVFGERLEPLTNSLGQWQKQGLQQGLAPEFAALAHLVETLLVNSGGLRLYGGVGLHAHVQVGTVERAVALLPLGHVAAMPL